jgi:hypothetical protein
MRRASATPIDAHVVRIVLIVAGIILTLRPTVTIPGVRV